LGGRKTIGDPESPTEANRETIREAFEAWKEGTGVIADVFAPELVCVYRRPLARLGEYESKQRFIDEVPAPFAARFSAGSNPFRPGRHSIDLRRRGHRDRDLGRQRHGQRRQPYENGYAWAMRMNDGRIVDGTAFFDSLSFNNLWTRVQPAGQE
jgi:ketosteroid isomerase-like protein